MKLINCETKQEVKIGDIVTSFRGEKYEVTRISIPHSHASSGRMHVTNGLIRQSFYPTVFNCKFIETT
jgi:hypothetical protein